VLRRSMSWVVSSLLIASVVQAGLTPPATAGARFHERAGKDLSSVAVAPDGSIYAVGARRVGITSEAFLIKWRPNGSVAWRRSWLPEQHASTAGIAVDVAPDGTVAWIGSAQAQCEGGGWFLETLSARGHLLRHWITPDWRCGRAEAVIDVAARGNLTVVAGFSHGCCSDPRQDGWVAGFGPHGGPRWTSQFEPPAPTPRDWFDRATGVALGAFGNFYVAGWAATHRIVHETDPTPGTLVLVKMTSSGRTLWSKRVGSARMPSLGTDPAISARGDRVMVSAPVEGRGVWWRLSAHGTKAWLGRFTTGGALVWSTTWDGGGKHASEPAEVTITPSGATWVVGTRRDPWDRGYDLSARRYGPGGGLLRSDSIDAGRYLLGTGVEAGRSGVYATGTRLNRQLSSERGRIWRLAG
jgi:hypothetical protein